MTNAIQVQSLTKYYGDFMAVDHINFEVRQGEVFGFLGPNGAGKTTTQRMLTTLRGTTRAASSSTATTWPTTPTRSSGRWGWCQRKRPSITS